MHCQCYARTGLAAALQLMLLQTTKARLCAESRRQSPAGVTVHKPQQLHLRVAAKQLPCNIIACSERNSRSLAAKALRQTGEAARNCHWQRCRS
jgi:hypothetical protein